MDVLKYEDYCPQHRPALIKHGLRFTKRLDVAEDLAQETLIRAYVFWAQFQPTTDDVSRDCLLWLRRILTNIFNSQHLRNKKREAAMDEYLEHVTEGDDENTDFIEAVQALIDKLKPDHKELIDAHYVKGLSYEETASALGIESTKVQKDLWRARQALKKLIVGAKVVNV